jgi:hypothetical protein
MKRIIIGAAVLTGAGVTRRRMHRRRSPRST